MMPLWEHSVPKEEVGLRELVLVFDEKEQVSVSAIYALGRCELRVRVFAIRTAFTMVSAARR
jgi:hypothetical protein